MIKSLKTVDEVAVKAEIEKQSDWSGFCSVCNKQITGTLADLRKHGACHRDKQG